LAEKKSVSDHRKIDLPDEAGLRNEIEKAILALDPEPRAALLSELKVRDPDGMIPKERVAVLNGLHDVYVFPLGRRTPCAVVVVSGYDNRHILAGVTTKRPARKEALALAAAALKASGQ
jgi:hypothetical protein